MDRIQALEVFVAVAEARSFIGGARNTGLSAPSITRGINSLEERLGARLFTRTTRRLRLTDVGQAYLEDARQILEHLQAANDAAAGAATNPVGQLKLTCSHEFGRIYVMPILTEFLSLYPNISVNVVMVDRIVNLVEEGFDIAVRIGHLPSSELSATKVGRVRRVVCGSPGYFAKNGMPLSPEELKKHNTITISPVSPSPEWKFGYGMDQVVQIDSRLTVSSVASGIAVARKDWGLTRVLSYQIGPDLENGTMQTVLEDFEPEPLPIHLVHVEGRRAAAKVRAFVELASQRLRAVAVLN
ncbi:LysR substrate-binding domain-containing protein [Parasphingorhabdus sp. DH2-15]|uniref:LysR substrate-binding domain-containing protein n=1 Tax=Parasphingorhabdus sp. DH2-15 TaxID=3444112 RepID=UPI003F6871C7